MRAEVVWMQRRHTKQSASAISNRGNIMDSNDLRELAEGMRCLNEGGTITIWRDAFAVEYPLDWLTTPEGTHWLTCDLARSGCTVVTRTADTPHGLSHIAEITCRGVTRARQADDLGEAMATAALEVLRAGRGVK
jgi:hypothetical protein